MGCLSAGVCPEAWLRLSFIGAVSTITPSSAVDQHTRALLSIPGLRFEEVSKFEQLREAGDASAFFAALLAWRKHESVSRNAPEAAVDVAMLGDCGHLTSVFNAIRAWQESFHSSPSQRVHVLQSSSIDILRETIVSHGVMHGHTARESIELIVRGAGNNQDYCAVDEDLRSVWPYVRPGGFVVLHGGAKADTEMMCSNGSMISGGVRAAAEDFGRGFVGVAGLDMGSTKAGQDLPTSLGRVVFPGSEAPYWLLRKMPFGEDVHLTEAPIFASPADLRDDGFYVHGNDEIDRQIATLLKTRMCDLTEDYWSWVDTHFPHIPEGMPSARARAGKLFVKMLNREPKPYIPRLLHQVYGFKCTNWKTGVWESTCDDEPAFEIPYKQLEQCFGDALPYESLSEKPGVNKADHEIEAEVEWGWTVMQQVVASCCGSNASVSTLGHQEHPTRLKVWSATRQAMTTLTAQCARIPLRCCREVQRETERKQKKPGTMRADFLRWSASWRHHHPDWKYVLWGPMEVKRLMTAHYPWLLPVVDNYPSWIYRNDVAPLVILHHFGGIIATMDMEALKSVNDALEGPEKAEVRPDRRFVMGDVPFYGGGVSAFLNEDGKVHPEYFVDPMIGHEVRRLDTHVMGFGPKHAFLHILLESLEKHQFEHVLVATGNERLTATFYEMDFLNTRGFRIMGREAYNPLDWSNDEMRRHCFDRDCSAVCNACYGIHHHSKSWFGLSRREVTQVSKATIQINGGNPACWSGDWTAALCCDVLTYGPGGFTSCWDGNQFTYDNCCVSRD